MLYFSPDLTSARPPGKIQNIEIAPSHPSAVLDYDTMQYIYMRPEADG